MKEFKLKQISYKGCKIKEGSPITLQLYHDHLYFHASSTAEVYDEDLGLTTEKEYNNTMVVMKAKIETFDIYYANNTNLWCVDVMTSTNNRMSLNFKTMKEAQEIFDEIRIWVTEPKVLAPFSSFGNIQNPTTTITTTPATGPYVTFKTSPLGVNLSEEHKSGDEERWIKYGAYIPDYPPAITIRDEDGNTFEKI